MYKCDLERYLSKAEVFVVQIPQNPWTADCLTYMTNLIDDLLQNEL